jgi:hypothetical protein
MCRRNVRLGHEFGGELSGLKVVSDGRPDPTDES